MKIILKIEGMHMCLIIFQKNSHPDYKLIVAANRDEFYERPTASAGFWQDHPEVLAGRDLSKGGTWLGLTKSGRFAAVTNIRKPGMDGTDKKSRGALVSGYLTGHTSPEQFLGSLEAEKDDYSGFNLLVGDQNDLFYLNNDGTSVEGVPDGTHGLSNHHLNTPWPKVVKGRSRLGEYLQSEGAMDPDVIFDILADSEEAEDNLPDTGLPKPLERKLSSPFISTPEYGTRSSTVILIDHEDNATFIERNFSKGVQTDEQRYSFRIE
ncbi:NRDE family protein [Salinicoccus bachuensis]|uniref:NRDE family protein n=1 Tax=Salinicoccus bachuensis TaxID=3136731 RepID=A0ABZ3CGH2_9STAP